MARQPVPPSAGARAPSETSIDVLVASKEYQRVEELILSGQVEDARMAELMATHPEFAIWLKERARERQGG